MGILDWFRKKPDYTLDPVAAPSAAYSSGYEAIVALVRASSKEEVPAGWLDFMSTNDGKEICIQVSENQVNLCENGFDVSIMLSRAGLAGLSRRTKALREDQITWEVEDGSSEDIASVVDAVLKHLCGKQYEVRGVYCDAS